MRRARKRRIVLGLVAALLLVAVAVPLAIYRSLTYEPPFYRDRVAVSGEARRAEADRFESQSLQLRNDIANEGRWEAAFSDEEVNAWLAEKLVQHFAAEIPPGVHDPIVAFETDRVILAFKLDQGPLTSLVWVVARARVAGDNTVALTLEKIRAGAMPVPAEEIIVPATRRARSLGLDITWDEEDGKPVAYIRYSPAPGRVDVVLEHVRVLEGQLYISGRSDRKAGTVSRLLLPDRRILQMTFPNRRGRPSLNPST